MRFPVGLAVVGVLFVAACGGDGNSDLAATPTQQPPATTTAEPVTLPLRPDQRALYAVNVDGSGLRKLWDEGNVVSFALSPDGTQMAFVSSEDDAAVLRLLDTTTGELLAAIDVESGVFVRSWSPDGAWIALDQGVPPRSAYVYALGSGEARQLATGRFQAWSVDGAAMYVRRYEPSVLLRVDLPSFDVAVVAEGQDYLEIVPAPDGAAAVGMVDFGPGGRDARYSIAVVAADGSSSELVSFDDEVGLSGGHPIAWSPDGARLAFGRLVTVDGLVQGSGVYAVDAAGGEVAQLTFPDEGVESEILWAPDGKHLLVRRAICTSCDGTGWKVVLASAGGSGEVALPGAKAYTLADAAWSPDGTRFAYSGDALYAANADGSDIQKLVDLPAASYGPIAWSKDGQRVYFLKKAALSVTYAVQPDGSGLEAVPYSVAPDGQTYFTAPVEGTLVLHAADDEIGPFDVGMVLDSVWSPDSEWLALESRTGGIRNYLEVIGIDGSRRTLATHDFVESLRWSPDGSQIAYNAGGLWVADLDGGEPRRLVDHLSTSSAFDWSPDGTGLAYAASGDAVEFVQADAAATGREPIVIDTSGLPVAGVRWSPDGERLAVASEGGVFIVDLASGAMQQVHEGSTRGFEWTRDSTRVVFGVSYVEDPSLPRGVFVFNADDGSLTQLTELIDPVHVVTSVLNDGRIVFVSYHGL